MKLHQLRSNIDKYINIVFIMILYNIYLYKRVVLILIINKWKLNTIV